MRKFYCLHIILTIIILSLIMCSCNSPKEDDTTSGGYRVKTAEIADVDGYQSIMRGFVYNNGSYCVQIQYDSDIKHFSKLYYYNNSGELVNTVDTKANYWIRFVKDNKIYAQYGLSEIAILNYDDASLIETVKIDDDVFDIVQADDYYIVCGLNNVFKYDYKNEVVASVEVYASEGYGHMPYFAVGDKEYLVLNEAYYSVDFDQKTIELLRSCRDIDGDAGYGQFVINYSGLFKLDLDTLEQSMVLDWSDVDIKPASKIVKNDIQYYIFDERNLAAVYDYSDDSAEVMFISYDEDYKEDRERLVIGGFRTNEDVNLKWAVYKYNQSQDKYRAVIEDYSEQFGSGTSYEAEKQNLALTKYWNEGHTPDMFCGMDFDYQSWGRSGIVKDINPLIQQYAPGLLYDVTPNIREAMSAGDKCYSVMTSYDLEGCFGETALLGGKSDVTIYDLASVKENYGKHMYDSLFIYDVTDSIMERAINSRRCHKDDGNVFDKKTMEYIVKFSFDNGQHLRDDFEFYQSGDYLLKSTSVGDVFWFAEMCLYDYNGERISFYGNPSVFGSVHMAQPKGIVAISSSTDKDEECIKLISYMLDEEVQTYSAIKGGIPVNQKVLDMTCEYAADPGKVPDGSVYKSYFDTQVDAFRRWVGNDRIPASVIEDYKNAIAQVDAIRTFDWGVFNILLEEMSDHELKDRTVADTAKAISSRLEVYLNENYG